MQENYIPFYTPINGKLRGIDLLQLASEYGMPVYVYDGEKISSQYQALQKAFPTEKLEIHFAMKSNNNPAILQHLRNLGSGLDTVSLGEVLTGLEAGFNPTDMVFTANGASFREIEKVVDHGVSVTLDNMEFIHRWIEKFSDIPVMIRINPSIVAGGVKKISTAHDESKFGLDMRYMDQLEEYMKAGKLKVKGWHIHLGSDVSDKDAFRQSADVLMDVASRYNEHLEYINFGGGFRIPYSPDEKISKITDLGNEVTERFNRLQENIGKELQLIIEPGKFLVSQAGFFLIETTVVKCSGKKRFAITDSGFSQFMRPMYYNAYHEIFNLSNPDGEIYTYDICGNICEEDNFAVDRAMPEIRVGDVLCICNAGAYGYSMASVYNLRPLPAEVFIDGNTSTIVRPHRSPQELVQEYSFHT